MSALWVSNKTKPEIKLKDYILSCCFKIKLENVLQKPLNFMANKNFSENIVLQEGKLSQKRIISYQRRSQIGSTAYLQGKAIHYTSLTKWNKSHVCKKKTCFISALELIKEIDNLKKMLKQTSALTQVLTSYMSSAIPKALFSICVNAPAPDALLQSPSVNCPESSSSVYL